MRVRIVGVTLLLMALACPSHAQQWAFGVYLDGKRIGVHRFDVERTDDDAIRVTSQAAFDVKVLKVPVFRYRHSAVELWRGNCLDSIDTQTQVNGSTTTLTGRRVAAAFDIAVTSKDGPRQEMLPDCVATFAYWDAATLLRHDALLNGQTGAYQQVARVLADDGAVLTLQGGDFRIDLGYAGGVWQTLATTTREGRRLDYRDEGS